MSRLSSNDCARIREILSLTGDPKDERYWINLRSELEFARALVERAHVKPMRPPAMRARLERVECAARALVRAIDAVPQDAPEASLLRSLMTGGLDRARALGNVIDALPPDAPEAGPLRSLLPRGLDGASERADELAYYCKELRRNIPKVGHKPGQPWMLGQIRGLARHFLTRTRRRPTSTPGAPSANSSPLCCAWTSQPN